MHDETVFYDQLEDYRRIEAAIAYLERNYRRQPSLDELAHAAHLSKYHFQRLFKRWAGITPTQFMHYLTVSYAKEQLAAAESVLATALDAGLSGPGRLHDLFVTYEALTPGEYKQQAAGLTVRTGCHPSPFGPVLLATTARGICALRFVGADGEAAALATLQAEWPRAQFVADDAGTAELAARIFSRAAAPQPFHLLLRGTNFQVQVWRALLSIPAGALVTYRDVAHALGDDNATRAVAGAVARNPIGYLIPCHRVISKVGRAHDYRWGSARKKALIGYEAAQLAQASA